MAVASAIFHWSKESQASPDLKDGELDSIFLWEKCRESLVNHSLPSAHKLFSFFPEDPQSLIPIWHWFRVQDLIFLNQSPISTLLDSGDSNSSFELPEL